MKNPKGLFNWKIFLPAALAALALALFAGNTRQAKAYGALCGTVEQTSPYFQMYCLGSNYPYNNSGYYPNYSNYNNYNNYNYGYPNSYTTNNNYGYNNGYDPYYNSTCDVVEPSSPYYQQYCMGYNNYYGNNYSYPTYNNNYSSSYNNNYPSSAQRQPTYHKYNTPYANPYYGNFYQNYNNNKPLFPYY